MRTEQMEYLFERNGYCKVPSNLPEVTFYYREESQGAVVLQVIDYRQDMELSEEQYVHLKTKLIEFMHARKEQEVHLLSIVLSSDTEKGRKLCACDSFCWMIDTDSDRLIIYEDQAGDFYGWRGILEKFLQEKPPLPWVTICLVAANVIIFLICTTTGGMLYNIGMLDFPRMVEDRAYYQIITSMFLHADISHLFNNMIMLYFLGKIVEQELGHVPYGVLYFLSGIAGDLLSIGYAMMQERELLSLGASGAVFGVEGAFLFLVILGWFKCKSIPVRRIVVAILLSLYCGFTSFHVDNAAHVGGILMGFALAAVFCLIRDQIDKV